MAGLLDRLKRVARPGAPEPVEADEQGPNPARMLFTTRRYPVFYLAITKCGCTYLKNLFYHLDHDALHADPHGIHDHGTELVRAGEVAPEVVRASPFAFTVVRDPVDRFLSLYFDKIHAPGRPGLGKAQAAVAARGLDLTPGIGAEAHRRNCRILIEWLEDNLAFRTDLPVNPHWRRQASRVKRVEALELAHLTLGGLDWQLPAFLGPAIPELDRHMAAVRIRNEVPRPVAKEDVLDEALVAEINRVYAQDREMHDAARAAWAARRDRSAPIAATSGETRRIRLLTTHRAPVQALVIPKAGCSFVRNLFYRIDHGRNHPEPLAIQADDCLVKRDFAREDLDAGGTGFIVLRDPMARFYSFYCDKVWGAGPHAFPWIAERLEERGFRRERDLPVEAHQENCRLLIGYIQNKIAMEGAGNVNPHFRPQSHAAEEAARFGLKPVLLDSIAAQLPVVLGDTIPDLQNEMTAIPRINESAKPFPMRKVIIPRMRMRIAKTYREDMALVERVRAGWAETGQPPVL
ncbi:MAG: sulfotransferase family 2 domain-containing protein [Pseudomonadota bacterium]